MRWLLPLLLLPLSASAGTLSLLHAGGSAGGSSFIPPALAIADGAGDSRIANGIGLGGTSLSLGYYEWFQLGTLNNAVPNIASGFGVGATTSLNLRDRVVSVNPTQYTGATAPTTCTGTCPAGSTPTLATGAETVVSINTNFGGLPGYLTPGSFQSPGWVTITFGTASSVSSTCGTGSGYTPFTITDNNGDTIPGECVQDAFNAPKLYGASTYGTALTPTSVTGNGTTATASWSGISYTFAVGSLVQINGMTPSGFNGGWVVTASSSSSVSWASSVNATASGVGTVTARSPYANFTVTQPASGTRATAGDVFTFETVGPQAQAYAMTGVTNISGIDSQWNSQSTGAETAAGSPSTSVLVVDSTNDGSATVYTSPGSGTSYGQCPGPDYPTYTSMPNIVPCVSMVDLAKVLDVYKTAGKTVFLADEEAQGTYFIERESHAVSASATTITSTNYTTFQYDGMEFGNSSFCSAWTGIVCSGTQAVPTTPGLIGVISGAYTVYTYTTGAPGVGQYSVNDATGVYTISASDPLSTTGGTAYLTYTHLGGGTSNQQKIMHAWLSSAASDFVWNGTDYHFPGALYNRPNVFVVPLFEAFVDRSASNWSNTDPLCVSHACVAAPAVLDTVGPHPTPLGGLVFENAVKATMSTIPAYASLTENGQYPKWNNIRCAFGNVLLLTFACTMPPDMLVTGHPHVQLTWYDNGTATVHSVVESGGVFTDPYIVSSSVNYSTGVVSIVFSASHPPNQSISLSEDVGNILGNPLFDTHQVIQTVTPTTMSGSGATVTASWASPSYTFPIGSQVIVSGATPAGYNGTFNVTASTGTSISWSNGTTGTVTVFPTLTSEYGYATDFNAPCAGTTGLTVLPYGWTCSLSGGTGLTITFSTGTDTDGYPTLIATFNGVASGSGTFTLTGLTAANHVYDAFNPTGTLTRSGMKVSFSQNSGHLFGLWHGHMGGQGNTSYTRPNIYTISAAGVPTLTPQTQQTAYSGEMSTSSYDMSDVDIGVLGATSVNLNFLAPPLDWITYAPTSLVYVDTIQWNAGPVTGTVTWGRAAQRTWGY